MEASLAAAFALTTLAAAEGWTHPLDEAVSGFFEGIQVQALRWVVYGFNLLGQGSVLMTVSGALTALLLWRTRNWRFALPWVLAFLFTNAIAGPVKIWSMRDAPSDPAPFAVEFFNEVAKADGYAMSYPSGHIVNAIVWWGVIVLLAARVRPGLPLRLMRVAPPSIVFVTTIYNNYHWVTDNLGGLALGLLIDRLIHRVDWDRVLE